MDKKHLDFDEILEFVCADKDMLAPNTKKYFSYINHFCQCEKCGKIRDDLFEIQNKVNGVIQAFGNDYVTKLKMRIAYSFDRLDMPERKYDEFFAAVKGTVSGKKNKSKIYLNSSENILCKNFDYVTTNEEDGSLKKHLDEITDEKLNTIALKKSGVSISLTDDGKENHSALIIPCNVEKEPMMYDLIKVDDKWRADCSCPEDDYEIVIF